MRENWFTKKLTSKENKVYNIILAILMVILIASICLLIYVFNNCFNGIDIKCDESFSLAAYQEEIDKVPEPILKSFIINQWSVSIEEEMFKEYLDETDKNAIGITGNGYRRIWLKDANATLHEFGHYIHFNLDEDTNKRIEEIYEREGKQCFDSRAIATTTQVLLDKNSGKEYTVYFEDDKILGYLGERSDFPGGICYFDYMTNDEEIEKTYPDLGHYATTSYMEYFADYFKYWINNREDMEKMQLLKEKTPETYELFEELESNDWGMNTTLYEKIMKKLVTFFYG